MEVRSQAQAHHLLPSFCIFCFNVQVGRASVHVAWLVQTTPPMTIFLHTQCTTGVYVQ